MESQNNPRMDWESQDLPGAFKKFKEHANFMFGGPLSKQSEDAQCNYLMLWVGEKGRQIHSTWNLTDEQSKQLQSYYDGFESYCAPKSNRIYNRYRFKSRVQEGGEPFESFVTELKVLIKDCGYPDTIQDEMIRDHIVFGIYNNTIREKLINEGSDLTLANCIDIARTYELSQTQVKNITGSRQSVSMVGSRKPGRPNPPQKERMRNPPGTRKIQHGPTDHSRATNVCGNCGYKHLKDKCPAKGKECLYCNKQNHFAKMCRKKDSDSKKVNEDEEERLPGAFDIPVFTEEFLDHNKEMERRRSSRKKKLDGTLEPEDNKKYFEARVVNDVIGRGVFSTKAFKKGDSLLKYDGILQESAGENIEDDTYIFEIFHKRRVYIIDSSVEDGTLGRLMNDSHYSPNCKPKLILEQPLLPAIWFYALKDIEPGDEIRYNYGPGPYVWRQKKRKLAADVIENNSTSQVKQPISTSTAPKSYAVFSKAPLKSTKTETSQQISPMLPKSPSPLQSPRQTETRVSPVQLEPKLSTKSIGPVASSRKQEPTISTRPKDIQISSRSPRSASATSPVVSPRKVEADAISPWTPPPVALKPKQSTEKENVPIITDYTQNDIKEQRDSSRHIETEVFVLISGSKDDHKPSTISGPNILTGSMNYDSLQPSDKSGWTQGVVSSSGIKSRDLAVEVSGKTNVVSDTNSQRDTDVTLTNSAQQSVTSEVLEPDIVLTENISQDKVDVEEVQEEFEKLSQGETELPVNVNVSKNRSHTFSASSESSSYTEFTVCNVKDDMIPEQINEEEETSNVFQMDSRVQSRGLVKETEEKNQDYESDFDNDEDEDSRGSVQNSLAGCDNDIDWEDVDREEDPDYEPSDNDSSDIDTMHEEAVAISPPSAEHHGYSVRASPEPQIIDRSEHMTEFIRRETAWYRDGYDSDVSITEGYDDSLHDPNYILKDSCSSDSDTSEIIEIFPALTVKRKVTTKPVHRKRPKIQVDKVTSLDEDVTKSSDRTNALEVQQSRNYGEKRKWDKIHFCLFCDDNSSTNIRKHYLSSIHSKESEIQRVLSYPSGSKERNLAWEKLRNAGDYKHNTNVLRKGEGVLITIIRSSEPTSAHDYLPCEFCLGFFLKWSLWRHKQTCRFNENHKKGRNVQAEARLLLPSSVEVSQGLKEDVISRMSGDEVSIAVKNDPIILKVGEKLYKKHGSQMHLHNHISQKMRELGRFLVKARMFDNKIIRLSDIIDARRFPLVITVTKALCQYDDKTNKYTNPSLALKLGHLLKKAARILRTESMIASDSVQKEKAIDFINVCEEEWTNEISFSALHTLTDNKRNKKKMLPLSEDISKLQTYLQRTSESLTENLEEGFSKGNWELLNKVTLAKLVMFNRRRGGETERMKVVQYENRRNKSEQAPKEVEESLSETEKVLLTTLSRVEIRGKRDRTVAVLLTQDIEKSIDLLLRYRVDAGVDQGNAYIFARANCSSLFPLRSADVLRQYAQEARLECPESVTSTKLRKHVATVVQILNLSKHDLEVLAGFMGHDINIHRSFYRLPQEIIEVARMGRLLTAFNKGTIGQFNGMSIDDIDLELDKVVSSDSEGDEEEVHEADDLTEIPDATKEGMEAVPVFQQDGVQQSCSVRSNTNKVTKPQKRCSSQHKTREVVKLTEAQRSLLKTLFKTNIEMRRELQKAECEKVSRKYAALQNLSWKKIKNTVHNWIMTEKQKMKTFFHSDR